MQFRYVLEDMNVKIKAILSNQFCDVDTYIKTAIGGLWFFSYDGDDFIIFVKSLESIIDKEYCYTWEDIKLISEFSIIHSKEEAENIRNCAKTTLRQSILENFHYDIKNKENAEEEIEKYLINTDNQMFFNKKGLPLFSKFIITLDSSYVRDAQVFIPTDDFNFEKEDIFDVENEDYWIDSLMPAFVGIVTAESIASALCIAANKFAFHKDTLTAQRIG